MARRYTQTVYMQICRLCLILKAFLNTCELYEHKWKKELHIYDLDLFLNLLFPKHEFRKKDDIAKHYYRKKYSTNVLEMIILELYIKVL